VSLRWCVWAAALETFPVDHVPRGLGPGPTSPYRRLDQTAAQPLLTSVLQLRVAPTAIRSELKVGIQSTHQPVSCLVLPIPLPERLTCSMAPYTLDTTELHECLGVRSRRPTGLGARSTSFSPNWRTT